MTGAPFLIASGDAGYCRIFIRGSFYGIGVFSERRESGGNGIVPVASEHDYRETPELYMQVRCDVMASHFEV